MSDRTADDEAHIEASKAPLLDHLVELRRRIIWSLITFAACFVVCFAFAKNIYEFLTLPLADALRGQPNDHLIYTALPEQFFVQVKVGMFGGLCLAFPVVAAQLYLFVAPGLYKNERRAFLPFLFASPILFVIGGSFVFFVMLPFAIHFFLGYQSPTGPHGLGIQLQAKVSDYLDLVTTLIFGFGLTFQLPVLMSLLGRVGIVTSQQLRSMRRYAIVGLVAVSAVFTPPDPYSMLSLMIPLIGLYEISIWCVRLIERDRAKKDAAQNA
jgi:sec-independent protein translocase protein TatC